MSEYTFALQVDNTLHSQNSSNIAYEIVEVEIVSNHGNQQYTCLYRIRVHGEVRFKKMLIKTNPVLYYVLWATP